MAIKDTLTLYKELLSTGVPEDQAEIQAHQLGSFHDFAGNITTLVEKIEKDLFWMRLIGGGMIIACFGVMFK